MGYALIAATQRGARVWEQQMDRGVRITRGNTVVYEGKAKIGNKSSIVGGLTTDVRDATASSTIETLITIPLSMSGLVMLGDRCDTGTLTPPFTGTFTPDGRTVYVGGLTDNVSGQTAVRIVGTQQVSAVEGEMIVLSRKVAGVWTELEPQPFQLTLANRQPEEDRSEPTRSVMYAGTMIGAIDADVRAGDRFEWDGYWSFVGDVDRSGGRTEAAFTQNRGA